MESDAPKFARKACVIIESPFAARSGEGQKDNIKYARRALRDSIMRGEAPFASHLLYTQAGVLEDGVPEERVLGIECGLAWLAGAEYTAVYCDLGISRGMQQGIAAAYAAGKPIFFRTLDGPLDEELIGRALRSVGMSALLSDLARGPAQSANPPSDETGGSVEAVST